ncbi:MAG: peptide-methionine (S)-S-oxide reductase MsrA [Erysipelotrichaceae bacterium]|nr:peptide-methionine (S)-S-oxide reductase MsrA [Erysipelotrichaceae bacterium]
MQKHVIYLAGGCFWGVEEYFSRLHGVTDTEVGYANADQKGELTYELVCQGTTNACEAVKVTFDDESISLREVLDAYFNVVDPTLHNRQGNDRGVQYRTGIYYVHDEDLTKIQARIALEQRRYQARIVTEVMPLMNFQPAETYHQDYLKKNPNGYCHIRFD